jgi:hypothetical protein
MVNAVHVNGGIIPLGNRKVMVVALHLTCCGTPGTWREYRRQLAAALIKSRIGEAMRIEKPDAVIGGGDMNLVAGTAALDTLLTALNTNSAGPLRGAPAVRTDGTDWTWDGRGTVFSQGKLDIVFYSSGSLTPAAARVWDTEVMPADSLRRWGLTPASSKSINRHRPVVVDFVFR